EPAPEVAPQHCDAADHTWVSGQAPSGHGQIIERGGPHEILSEASPNPPGPDTLLAGALRAKVDEADGLEVDAFGDPAEHPRPMAVDAVPHHLTDKSADLPEAGDPIEFGHADGHLAPADLRNQRASLRMHEPRLPGRGPNARIALHPL